VGTGNDLQVVSFIPKNQILAGLTYIFKKHKE
jgi:hypothetical protein